MRSFFVFFCFLLLQTAVLAQSDSISVDDMYLMSFDELLQLNVQVQVSSNKGENIFSTPSTISIVDKAMIEAYNFQTVSELVQCISGMTVSRTILKRNLPTARGILQDNYANKVLILINGVPTWNAVTGEGNLERININDLERVEILKGPASVLYGTNAYTGAINLVLKKEAERTGMFYSEIGSYHTLRSGGNVAVALKGAQVFFGAGTKRQTGASTLFTGEDSVSGYMHEYINTSSVTTDVRYRNHRFLANVFSSEESCLGASPTFASGAGNAHTLFGVLTNYEFTNSIGDAFSYRLGTDYDFNERNFSRSQDDDVRANISGFRTNSYLQLTYEINKRLNAEVGGNIEYRKCNEYKNYNIISGDLAEKQWDAADTVLDGNNGMKNLAVNEASAFSQLHYSAKRLTALVGARYTLNSLFDSDISSRATLVYLLNSQNSVKLMYGESFRSPSFFETNFYYTTVMGNEALKPEKSQSFELSYLTSFDKFFVQALVYHGIYTNKIYRQKRAVLVNDTSLSMNVYQNGAMFTASGLEIELKYANPKFISGFVQYSCVSGDHGDVVDSVPHYNFKYVPEHTFAVGLHKKIQHFGISVLGNYTHKTEGFLAPISSFYTIDLNLQYEHSLNKHKVKHAVSVKNLTDSDVVYPEYTRRKVLNEIPAGMARYVSYSFKFLF